MDWRQIRQERRCLAFSITCTGNRFLFVSSHLTRHTTFIVTLYQLSLGIFTQCRHPCAGYIHRQHAIICHVYELIIIRTIKCNYMLGQDLRQVFHDFFVFSGDNSVRQEKMCLRGGFNVANQRKRINYSIKHLSHLESSHGQVHQLTLSLSVQQSHCTKRCPVLLAVVRERWLRGVSLSRFLCR